MIRAQIIGVLSVVLLNACSPPPRVEVVERTTITVREQTERIGGSLIRIVQPGDTLHAIAFATRQNVNDIAAWNNISDTSRLEVGQRIRMTKPLNFKPKTAVLESNDGETIDGARAKPLGKQREPIVVVQIEPSAGGAPSANRSPQVSKTPPIKPMPPSVAPPSSTAQSLPKPQPSRAVRWSWPTKGSVITRFAVAQGRQGIDIQGQAGQPVVATDAGEVVYVGNGLKGYGNLVIIKHSDTFLSAYAHNRETFVREGELVAARHVIGSIGQNRQRRNALHFQIRKNGKPVNPLVYLPKI